MRTRDPARGGGGEAPMWARGGGKKKGPELLPGLWQCPASGIRTDGLSYGRLWVLGMMMQTGLVLTLLGV